MFLLLACTISGDSASNTDSPLPTDCTQRSVDECVLDDQCTLLTAESVTFDTANGCYTVGNAQGVGCLPIDTGCGAAMTYAVSEGICYQFRSTCLPPGWTGSGTPGEACQVANDPQECP